VLTPPPVKVAAERLGVPVLQPARLRGEEIIEHLAALQPDVGVVAAYGEILRTAVLDIPPLGYLNIHPSLLPLHRGPAPVVGAILAGESETGVTIMKLDEHMDSGPMLAQVTIPMPPGARAGALTHQLFRLGTDALLDVLPRYAAGELELRPQDDSQATFTKMLKKTDGHIDWSQPALVIERMVRAYDPWPGAYTTWKGQQVRLTHTQVQPDWTGTELPGTIVAAAADGPLVATGGGALHILDMQPSGKRGMSGRDWLAGQRDVVGQQFDANE
jgi:methionyl-tRNA formyltransferase